MLIISIESHVKHTEVYRKMQALADSEAEKAKQLFVPKTQP